MPTSAAKAKANVLYVPAQQPNAKKMRQSDLDGIAHTGVTDMYDDMQEAAELQMLHGRYQTDRHLSSDAAW